MVAVDHTYIQLYFREINCIYSIKCIAKEDDTYKRRAHMKMNINTEDLPCTGLRWILE